MGGPSASLAEGKAAAQDKPSCLILQVTGGLLLRSWDRRWSGHHGSFRGREAEDLGLAAPAGKGSYFSRAELLGKWLKSEAKCHIARPLKSGLKGKENDCQSVRCSSSTQGP